MGADVIVTPRTTGTSSHRWKTAGAMAAITAGAYFISSNRAGVAKHGQEFGGGGFAISPEGNILGETTPDAPLIVTTVDLRVSRDQKKSYPCYVQELRI